MAGFCGCENKYVVNVRISGGVVDILSLHRRGIWCRLRNYVKENQNVIVRVVLTPTSVEICNAGCDVSEVSDEGSKRTNMFEMSNADMGEVIRISSELKSVVKVSSTCPSLEMAIKEIFNI